MIIIIVLIHPQTYFFQWWTWLQATLGQSSEPLNKIQLSSFEMVGNGESDKKIYFFKNDNTNALHAFCASGDKYGMWADYGVFF